jgi:hypothetical protein
MFKAHKDTEKEPGMFGTLAIRLPSVHTGGELRVTHRSETEMLFSNPKAAGIAGAAAADAAVQGFAAAAFYADCEHELLPVTSGHRLVLAFNLVRTGSGPRLSVEDRGSAGEVRAAVLAWEAKLAYCGQGRGGGDDTPTKLVLPLEHAYTEALSFDGLKGRDEEVVAALQDNCGLDLHLVLVEKYEMGSASGGDGGYEDDYDRYRGRRGYYHDDDEDEDDYDDYDDDDYGRDDDGEGAIIDDVCESSITCKKWVAEDGSISDFAGLSVDDDEECLGGEALFDDKEPDRSEYEGYTGNAGPTLEQWYYACVCVMWPKSHSVAISCEAGFSGAVQLAARRLEAKAADAPVTLTKVTDYALTHSTDRLVQAGLGELLQVAVAAKDRTAAKRTMGIMQGPSSVQVADAMVASVKAFSWARCCSQGCRKIYFCLKKCRSRSSSCSCFGGRCCVACRR